MSDMDVKVEAQPALNGWSIDIKAIPSFDSPIKMEAKSARLPSPSHDTSPSKPSIDDIHLPKPKTGRRKVIPPPVVPILIDHLPTAWDEAHETFEGMEKCVYERKNLGLSREQDEMMVCDCVYDKRKILSLQSIS